jgi:hypothetical protein
VDCLKVLAGSAGGRRDLLSNRAMLVALGGDARCPRPSPSF